MGTFVVGDVLAGKYEVKAILGAGGMGTVYRARQLDLGRDVAIKVPMPQALEIPGFLARFSREAKLVAKLVHDNIVQVYEYQESSDAVYIVMEYVEGQDLKALLGKPPADLRVKDVAQILRASCEGLAHAHEAGIVHRDIKPHNIMVAQTSRGRWRVKIMDFGIAHMDANMHATMLGGEQLTVTGQAIGTPSYMSPEQIRGTGVTHKSDIYSMGCVIHYCFTRQTPFAGTGFTVAASHLSDPPPSVRLTVPALPPELEAIIFDCLEKDPGTRPEDASELGERLYKSLEPMFDELMVNLWPGARDEVGGTEALRPTAAMEPTVGGTVAATQQGATLVDGEAPAGPSSDRRPIPSPGRGTAVTSAPKMRRDATQTSPTNTAPGTLNDATIPYASASLSESNVPVSAAGAQGTAPASPNLPLVLGAVLVPVLLITVGVSIMIFRPKSPAEPVNGGANGQTVTIPADDPAISNNGSTEIAGIPGGEQLPIMTPVVSTPISTTRATPSPVPTPTVSPLKAREERYTNDFNELKSTYAADQTGSRWIDGFRLWRQVANDDQFGGETSIQAKAKEIAEWLAFSVPVIAVDTRTRFSIGTDDPSAPAEERPAHNVTLSPFSMGVYEVTALEFATFLSDISPVQAARYFRAGSNVEKVGEKFRPVLNRESHPANAISWEAANAYANWLSDRTGRRYRLPTEAEWEAAATPLGTRARFPWGSAEVSPERANRNNRETVSVTDNPTGAHSAGFRHLAGNVAEWTLDWFDENTYSRSQAVGNVIDPKGATPAEERTAQRVIRGGGFNALQSDELRVTARGRARPNQAQADFGFRLVLSP